MTQAGRTATNRGVPPAPENPVVASRATFVFIIVTVTLDFLAFGIIAPVLPNLIIAFEGGNMARASDITGYFGFAWNLMQFLFLPITSDFTLVPMDEEEAAERELRGRRIHASRPTLAADTTWKSDTETVFDGTYRHLLRAAKAKDREG